MERIGRTVMPGSVMGISRNEMPSCGLALGSVRTRQNSMSAIIAWEVQIFWPSTTQWSPSSTARVRSEARSEPALGSEKPCDQNSRPSRMAGR
jgi:hypothetical protein